MLHTLLQLVAQYQFVNDCDPKQGSGRFLGLPYWFEYLPGQKDALGRCVPTFNWNQPESLWGVGLALIDILLRVVVLVAVGFVIYAGFQYMTSSGEPDKTKAAKETIVNALIGMVIAIVASVIVGFIGNSIR